MPKIDGFQVLERIHSNPGLAGAVIMMLSGEPQLADAARCREFGVKQCLTKPVGQSELLDAILSALGVHRRRGTIDRSIRLRFRKSQRDGHSTFCLPKTIP